MKKSLLTILSAMALIFCSCQKEDQPNNNNNNNNDEPEKVDVTPYLGAFNLTRTAELNIAVLTFNIPFNRELGSEPAVITADPTREGGVIMTLADTRQLQGTVTNDGLTLDNEVLTIDIDTSFTYATATIPIQASVDITAQHPTIAAPADGMMEWSSDASGSAQVATGIPMLGTLSANITGTIHYAARPVDIKK